MRTTSINPSRVAEVGGGPVGLRGQALAAALLAVVVCLAITGCGSTPNSVPPATPTEPGPEMGPEPTAAPPALPLPTVDPVSGTQVHRATWRLLTDQNPTASQIVVEVEVGGPPCDVVTELEVLESTTTVELTVWAGAEEGTTQDCSTVPLTLGTHALVVPLDEALAERAVIDPR